MQAAIDAAGVSDNVTAVNGDARQLPFDDDEFDAIVSVDAFEYFGTDVHFLPGLLRVLRPGGAIAMSTPALSVDPYVEMPPAQVTALVGWEAAAWHTPEMVAQALGVDGHADQRDRPAAARQPRRLDLVDSSKR